MAKDFMEIAEEMASEMTKGKNKPKGINIGNLNMAKMALGAIPKKVKILLFCLICLAIYGTVLFSIDIYHLIIWACGLF